MARTIAIWGLGIFAAGIFGGYIAVRLSPAFDPDITAFVGFAAGAAAFSCARLWLTERRS